MLEGDPGDRLAAHLAQWASEMAAEGAAGARTRERWLRQQAAEASTLVGVLVDHAERGTTATLTTRSSSYVGAVSGVGQDFCVLSGRTPTIVALRAAVAIGAAGAGRGPSRGGDGGRSSPLDMDLVQLLGLLSADRTPVRLTLDGGFPVSGLLTSLGEDVATVLVDSSPRRLLSVVLAAIEACTLI